MCCSASHNGAPQTANAMRLHNSNWGDGGFCKCTGTDDTPCCGNATRDDGLCDRCRENCGWNAAEPAESTAQNVVRFPDRDEPIPYVLMFRLADA